VMLRPSYVLGGRAMEIVHDKAALDRYLHGAVRASADKPVLVDRFLDGAIEVDVDVVCDGKRAVVGGIMQHIEEAGIHSGDSACVLPPHSLDAPVIEEIAYASRRLALELGVCGLMNVQMAVRRDRVYVIEVNPRASRTVPFVSKATGLPLAALATKVMVGQSLNDLGVREPPFVGEMRRFAVKEAVLPFLKFAGVDPLLGPEMRSTGEVMGIDDNYETAFAKSQIAAGMHLPEDGTVFVSVADVDKEAVVPAVARLSELGFRILATGGTHRFLSGAGIETVRVNKVREGSPHVLEAMESGEVGLVINTTVGAAAVTDSASLRRTALTRGIPYFTTMAAADAATRAIKRMRAGPFAVEALQTYLEADRKRELR
jgi:carbamoyl-phosphate synthase large subunit